MSDGTDLNIFQDDGGEYCLTLNDTDDATYAFFEERGLQGGGYTWLAIVKALLDLRMPGVLEQLRLIDAEADNMYAYSMDRALLERIADLIREACADRALLTAAMDHAGEQLE
jgi:hypothetical protein